MSSLIIFILSIALIITTGILSSTKRYTEMLVGTIVGKYRGNLVYRGYIIVEMEQTQNKNGTEKIKIQRTYEVPEEYYKQKNIGDKGLFPC
jgi:hypothetical protein